MCDDECTMETCENFKANGDLMFCFVHRHNWRGFCKINGIEEIDIPSSETELLLGFFCGRITEKEYYEKLGYGLTENV